MISGLFDGYYDHRITKDASPPPRNRARALAPARIRQWIVEDFEHEHEHEHDYESRDDRHSRLLELGGWNLFRACEHSASRRERRSRRHSPTGALRDDAGVEKC